MAPKIEPEKTPEPGGDDNGKTPPAGDFKPIESQDEFDKRVGERVARERAKFADYPELKSKAAKMDEFEAANKTEAQKLADEKTRAEKERDDAKAESLRWRTAAKYGISDEDATLLLTASDAETLELQAQRLGKQVEDRLRNGNRAPTEGKTALPTGKDADEREFVRKLFTP